MLGAGPLRSRYARPGSRLRASQGCFWWWLKKRWAVSCLCIMGLLKYDEILVELLEVVTYGEGVGAMKRPTEQQQQPQRKGLGK